MGKKLENKIAVITGGSSGFGREIAILFAQEGAQIVLWDINEKGGMETLSLLNKKEKGLYYKVDVCNSEEIRQATLEIEKNFGQVDILINNAGIHQNNVGTVAETSEDEYKRVMDTNVKGTFLCSKYLIPLIQKRGKGGAIVNIASVWGIMPSNKVPIYCAAKAAVIQLTKAMALDHAQDKIRVNCICPGSCKTPLVESMIQRNYRKFGFPSPEHMWESRVKAHPLGRLGEPQEVAQLTLFLASEASSWMTGSIIIIDGGYSLGKSFIGDKVDLAME